MPESSLPSRSEIAERLLTYLVARGMPTETTDCYEEMARQFQLSAKQRDASYIGNDGVARNTWEREVRFGRRFLKDERLLVSSRRGMWMATEQGKNSVASKKR
jgi:restriction endonuclease Mrr